MIKKILGVIVGLLLLVVLVLVGVVTFINPNDFKPVITQEVKKITGRDLVINGDITWNLFPSLGLSVEQLSLKNPAGFAEPDLVRFERADVSVSVLPLLSQKLDFGVMALSKAHIFVQTLADGKSNLDGLLPNSQTPQDSQPPSESQTTTASAWEISIGGVQIADASAIWRNDVTKTRDQINDLNVTLGQVAFDAWTPIDMSLQAVQNDTFITFKGKGNVYLDKVLLKSQLRDLDVNATFDDKTLKIEQAALKIDQLGLEIPAMVNFVVNGKNADLTFDSSGKATVVVGELQNDQLSNIEINGIDLAANLSGKSIPNEKMKLSALGEVIFDNLAKKASLDKLTVSLNDATVMGNAAVLLADVPKVSFDLQSDKIDLDRLLGLNKTQDVASKTDAPTTQKSPTTEKSPAPLSTVEPDLSALKLVDVQGNINVGTLIAANLTLDNIKMNLELQQGKLTLNELSAALYDGTISANGSVDSTQSPARYQLANTVKNVEIQPLLMDLGNIDLLSGKGNVNVNLNGVGLSQLALRNAVSGTVGVNFANGQLYGVNIPEMIREASAALKGKQAEYVKEERKTDFSGFSGTFTIGKGNAETRNLKITAPNIGINSEGVTNLVNETLAFNVFVKLSKANESDPLKGLTIPVKIAGTWQAPTYSLDLQGLLTNNKTWHEKVKQEAQRGLEKLLGDKSQNEDIKKITDSLLNNLFN